MHAKGLSGSSVSCAVGKRPGQDSMRARVEAAIASENDGLSPPSAGSCRCPRPKRGDGFAFVSHFVVDEWCVWCACVVCGWRLFAHCREDVEVHLGDRSVSSVRVMARVGKWSCSRATPIDRGTGHWGRRADQDWPGEPECLSARPAPAALAVCPSQSRLFRRGSWRRGRIMKSWLEILLLLARCPPYYCVEHMQGRLEGVAGQGRLTTSLASQQAWPGLT